MCPSVLGRVETRTAILIGPAILGLILYFALDNLGYLVLLGIYYLVGVALDTTIYPQIIKWQPPWLTFVLGAGEFVIVYVLGQVLNVPLQPIDAIWFYWVSWVMAVWTRIVILPIVRHPFCRYDYAIRPGLPLHRYGIEQQAEIVRHAFLLRRGAAVIGAPELGRYESILPFGT